jgi:hypothetical protein
VNSFTLAILFCVIGTYQKRETEWYDWSLTAGFYRTLYNYNSNDFNLPLSSFRGDFYLVKATHYDTAPCACSGIWAIPRLEADTEYDS